MSEITFTTQSINDGRTLFGRSHPVENPKAVLSLVHGLGEHSGRYAEMAGALNGQGIAVNLIDLRGHGKSEGGRGVCTDFELMLDDVEALLDYTREAHAGLPHFLMGHSMGGLLVLTYGLKRKPQDIKAFISQAPALKPTTNIPGIQIAIMKFLRPLLPGLAASNGIDPKTVSKDETAVNAYKTDPLVHNKISIGLGVDLLETGEWVRENANQWTEPLLIMHGDNDMLTSCEASAAFAASAGDCVTFETVKDGYHEIHNDPERAQVYARVAEWITGSLSGD